MVINAKKFSDVVLVYDQYYAKKPKSALLMLERIALCGGLCLCAMMFVLVEYGFQISAVRVVVMSILFSAGFSLLFLFVRKRFAIPAVLVIMGIATLFTREKIVARIPYIADAFWLLLDGRFVPGKVLADHDLNLLSFDNPAYYDAVSFGFMLIVFLFCMVTAACLTCKTNIFPSLVFWILLWVPTLVSEQFTFSFWLVSALAMYMGAFVLTTVYGQGIALGRGLGGTYREAAVRNERSFSNALARAPYIKQVQMRTAYYSKYFSAVMYVAAVFAVIGLVSGTALSSSKGFDYTKLYDFVKSLGEDSPFTNPFDKSTDPGDWMTEEPTSDLTNRAQSLSIINPGRGNQRILSVKNTGNVAVYLRGDIGIDFTGDNWTSLVNDEPAYWRESGLAEYYRPVELQILKTIQGMPYSDDDLETADDTVSYAAITAEYLCDSKVAYLPAYTYDFGYFDNKMFNIYGDFVARVEESYGRMDSVNCTALVPDYTNMDDSSSEAGLESIRKAAELAQADGGISDIINGGYFLGHMQAYDEYSEYVRMTYMDVPSKYRAMISNFSAASGLENKAAEIRAEEDNSIVESYRIASEIADYLRSNYTYSLDTDNSGDNPLNSFLNETKSGHCAMYASAMTLVLRDMGIPARYCAGFVVKPNGGEPTILRSKNFHAWVEVYLDELGWVTFDPTSSSQTGETPAAADNSELPQITSSSPSESKTNDSSDREPESDSQSEELSDPSEGELHPDKQSANVLPYILAILVVLAVVAAAVFVVRYYKHLRVRALVAIRKIRSAGNTDLLLEKIHSVMKICGITQKTGELPNKFYARAEKAFGCSIKDYKDLIQAAAFSSKRLDTTECARLAGLLERLYESAEKKLDVFDRIRLRLALFKRKSPREQ